MRIGTYVDLLDDFGTNTRRLSIGPEVGLGFFGIDGGYLLSSHDRILNHGFQLRALFFFIGFVGIGVRWGQ